MGSPYMMFQCNRVNVCRTAAGFRRLSQEILSITRSLELLSLTQVVSRHIGVETGVVNHDDLLETVMAPRTSFLAGNSSAFKEHYWDLLQSLDTWTPSTSAYVDLCDAAAQAATLHRRTVCVFATNYATTETRQLDRAIVFDFTKKGH